jgi:hypothetical protein
MTLEGRIMVADGIELDLTAADMRHIGKVYRSDGGFDYLICYSMRGLACVNVDEKFSHLECFDATFTRELIKTGKETNLEFKIQEK